jgi:hypothetical protein
MQFFVEFVYVRVLILAFFNVFVTSNRCYFKHCKPIYSPRYAGNWPPILSTEQILKYLRTKYRASERQNRRSTEVIA